HDPRCTLNPGVIIPSADWAPLADLKVGPDAAPIPDDIAARLREVERTASWATPKLDLATPTPQGPKPQQLAPIEIFLPPRLPPLPPPCVPRPRGPRVPCQGG